MEEILKFLGANFAKLIIGSSGVFSVTILNHLITKWKIRSKRDKRIYNNNCQILVGSIIIGLKSLTGASRVNMWQYTNGKKDLSGICFEYVTCTHEKTAANVSSLKADFQSTPLDTYMRKIITRISDCKEDFLLLESKKKTGDDKIMMDMFNNVCSYNFKIFQENVWNGVVTISFDKEVYLSDCVVHEILIEMANIKQLHQKMIN